jgi:hypothetical protein
MTRPSPSRRPTRLRRLAVAAVLAVGVPVVFAPATTAPVAAQANEKDRLDRRKVELDAEIVELDRQLAQVEATIAARTGDLRSGTAVLDVVADDLVRAVEARKVPARLRVAIAIDAYERGDRGVTNLLTSLLVASTDAERLGDLETQRQIYRAVVQDADAKLAAADQTVRDLTVRSVTQQDTLRTLQQQLAQATARKKELDDRKLQRAAERADVQRRIDEIVASAQTSPFTGLPNFADRNRAALVVKIDNVDQARPPVGIARADVVYEELVEGGLSRLAAVFHSNDVDVIGPVRSARSTDVRLFTMLNRPLFANSGGNAGVRAEIADSTLVDVGNSFAAGAYWRDNSRIAPHNLFASTNGLRDAGAGRAGSPPPMFSFRGPGAPVANASSPATGVTVRFGATVVDYDWNGSGWARRQNGTPHVDSDGAVVAPTNVIVQFTGYKASNADPGSPEAIMNGFGEAWVLTGGRLVRAAWARRDDNSVFVYTDQDGKPVLLAPGTTWIELPPLGRAELR